MMKRKLKNDDPRRGPADEYFLCLVKVADGQKFVLPFTKHEVQRAFARRKRVFSIPLPRKKP